MVRFLMRMFLSAPFIVLVSLVIFLPMMLGVFVTGRELLHGHGTEEHVLDVLEGVGVILIGWGVAMEERGELRAMFRLITEHDEPRQLALDHVCHASGVGLLIFGLFAEIAVEAVRLPNDVVYTENFDWAISWVALFFILCGGLVQIQHIINLARAAWLGYRPEVHAKPMH